MYYRSKFWYVHPIYRGEDPSTVVYKYSNQKVAMDEVPYRVRMCHAYIYTVIKKIEIEIWN